ncbi:hypothetical protein KC887_05110 [Candidatus Kaiserbacteria bacterium]|nr:hypothetical protein [Candidatus Kaiserbacteria bacterium]
MRESKYQANLIKDLEEMFPGCIVQKNDPNYRQGMPDLAIFYLDRWAMLEVKTSAEAEEQPNQRYWVERTDDMSFGAFIYPAIEGEVLARLRRYFYER